MSRRLLLVDDEPSIVQTLTVILQHHGFEVTSAGDVASALQAISSKTFDILVTDLNIGEPGDGFTVVSALRRTHPEAIALIITGFPAFDKALQAIREQVEDFLVKPIHPRDLVAAIEKTVHTRRVHIPVMSKRISEILREAKSAMIAEWLACMRKLVESTPQSGISDDDLLNHLGSLVDELSRAVENPESGLQVLAKDAATKHGIQRAQQHFSATFILQEITAIRQVILNTIHHNLMVMNLSSLFVDLAVMSESLDQQLSAAMNAFLGQPGPDRQM